LFWARFKYPFWGYVFGFDRCRGIFGFHKAKDVEATAPLAIKAETVLLLAMSGSKSVLNAAPPPSSYP